MDRDSLRPSLIFAQRKDVFIDEVNANRLGLGSQYPGSQCNLIGIPCYVADFLRNDQINLSIETVLKKPGPFFSVLHVRCSLSLIHIEVHQRPVWTQSDGINELLLMKEQVVLIRPVAGDHGMTLYDGCKHAVGGPLILDFVNAAAKYSGYDVADILKEIQRKSDWYDEKYGKNGSNGVEEH